MSEKKYVYRARPWMLAFGDPIERLESVGETEKFVTLAGSSRKIAKTTDADAVRDTWEEARDWLLERAKKDEEFAKKELLRAHDYRAKIEAMRNPEAV
jgi:hypothetical protein